MAEQTGSLGIFGVACQRLAIKRHGLGDIAQQREVGDVACGFRHRLARLLGRTALRLVFALEGVFGGQRVTPRQRGKGGGQAGTLTRGGFRQLACEVFDGSAQGSRSGQPADGASAPAPPSAVARRRHRVAAYRDRPSPTARRPWRSLRSGDGCHPPSLPRSQGGAFHSRTAAATRRGRSSSLRLSAPSTSVGTSVTSLLASALTSS